MGCRPLFATASRRLVELRPCHVLARFSHNVLYPSQPLLKGNLFMRNIVIRLSLAFCGAAFVFHAPLAAADMEEELKKATAAWTELEKHSGEMEAWYTVTHHFAKSGKVDTTEFHATLKGESRKVDLRDTTPGAPDRNIDQTGVMHGPKAFFVHRNAKDAANILDGVVSPEAEKIRGRFLNYVDLYLYAPWQISLQSLTKWVRKPEFSVASLEPEIKDGHPYVRMVLRRDPKTIKPRDTLSLISVLLDPSHDWRIVEHDCSYSFGRFHVAIDYRPDVADTLLALKRVHRSGFDQKGIPGDQTTAEFTKIAYSQTPDESFQMSAFGLPDIPVPQSAAPGRLLYLWISLLVLALLCGVAAILLRKKFRRGTAS
jgi:hypothetical protein